MEENQIIVDVGLDAFIESLRHLQKQYELNTAALKAMKDAGEEQSDAYIMLTQEQKVLRQQIASTEKTMQNEIKMQQAQEGSLVQLRAQLANLQKQYDSMSGMERMGEAGTALQKRIKALHDEVLGLEGDTGRMQRNVGNYPGAVQPLIDKLEDLTKQMDALQAAGKADSDEFKALTKQAADVKAQMQQLQQSVDGIGQEMAPLKQQIKDATNELMQMKLRGEENTEQYRQMLEHLGRLKDTMLDTQAEIKQMASDTSALNSVLDGAKAAAGGFSVALGVMNLVGDKDSETAKELAEAQTKLQSAIAITTGLQAVQNALQKESALMMGVNKLRILAAAAAQRAYAAATRDAEAAQAVFNKVAKSNIYVWLAGIILTVVGAIYAFTRGSKEQEEQTKKTNIQLKTQVEYLQQLNDQYQTLASRATKEAEARLANAKAHGKSTKEIRKYEDELFDVQIANLNALEEKLGYSRRQHEKLKWEYERQVEEYEEGVRRMAENAGKVPQVVTEVAQAALDEQKKHLEETKKMLDQFDSIVDERTRLNTERAAQEKEREKEDKEKAKAAAAAAKQRNDLIEQETAKAQRAILALIEEGTAKQIALENQSYEEEKKALEKSLDEAKKKYGAKSKLYQAYASQLETLAKQHEANLQEIGKQADEESIARQADVIARELELATKGTKEEFDLRRRALDMSLAQELADEQLSYEQRLLIEKKYNKDKAAIDEEERLAYQAKASQVLETRLAEAKLAMQKTGEIELQMLKENMDNLFQLQGETDAEFYARRLAAAQAYADKKRELDQQEMAMAKAKADYMSNITSSISSLMQTAAGDNEALVRASKVVALGEIAIKQGVAIAEAVASAAKGDPYTYSLRVASAIASTVAAMAKAIASINKSGFEQGGVIGGYRGATTGKDNTYISARNGEMVINADQQKRLYDIANGSASSNLTASLVEALQAMPAPVLVYSELKRFENNVNILDELSNLN